MVEAEAKPSFVEIAKQIAESKLTLEDNAAFAGNNIVYGIGTQLRFHIDALGNRVPGWDYHTVWKRFGLPGFDGRDQMPEGNGINLLDDRHELRGGSAVINDVISSGHMQFAATGREVVFAIREDDKDIRSFNDGQSVFGHLCRDLSGLGSINSGFGGYFGDVSGSRGNSYTGLGIGGLLAGSKEEFVGRFPKGKGKRRNKHRRDSANEARMAAESFEEFKEKTRGDIIKGAILLACIFVLMAYFAHQWDQREQHQKHD